MISCNTAGQPSIAETKSGLRCTVIVPVHKGGAIFAACVESVAAALRPGDEFIVVADGEGDGSWQFAEAHGGRVVKLDTRGGPSRARNAGAEAATGDILFFVDADVTIPADALQNIVRIFESEPDLAALIGSYDECPANSSFLSQFKNLFHHYVHQRAGTNASTFWGACGAIRRPVFLEVGGFSEKYARPSIEDIELGYRLKAGRHRILLAPHIQVTHWKRWDAYTLLKTDILDRAAPWTELILDEITRRKVLPRGDLNLGWSYRLSILTSFAIVLVLLSAPFVPVVLFAVPLLAGCFLYLHLPLFRFFREQRGRWFCAKAVIWRFGYDLYSGIGFVYGSSRFARRASVRVLSQAFARLDPIAFGIATGACLGLAVAAATLHVALTFHSPSTHFLGLMAQYFPGYGVSLAGSAVGGAYGFMAGSALGVSIAWLRNTITRLYLGYLRVKRWTGRFAAAQRAAS